MVQEQGSQLRFGVETFTEIAQLRTEADVLESHLDRMKQLARQYGLND